MPVRSVGTQLTVAIVSPRMSVCPGRSGCPRRLLESRAKQRHLVPPGLDCLWEAVAVRFVRSWLSAAPSRQASLDQHILTQGTAHEQRQEVDKACPSCQVVRSSHSPSFHRGCAVCPSRAEDAALRGDLDAEDQLLPEEVRVRGLTHTRSAQSVMHRPVLREEPAWRGLVLTYLPASRRHAGRPVACTKMSTASRVFRQAFGLRHTDHREPVVPTRSVALRQNEHRDLWPVPPPLGQRTVASPHAGTRSQSWRQAGVAAPSSRGPVRYLPDPRATLSTHRCKQIWAGLP